MSDVWMVCSVCRTELPFGGKHWVCSVSTCNRNRTRLVFCSVACWDAHLAGARHREAWAVEAIAPTREAWAVEQAREDDALAETVAMPASPPAASSPASASSAPRGGAPSPPRAADPASGEAATDEILVVVSKMKKYIKDRSGMNTSDAVAEMISDHVRAICDAAIRTAAAAGRKTVLDRDVPRVPR